MNKGLLCLVLVFIVFHAINSTMFREKRQLTTLRCSDGSLPVSLCFSNGTCNLGYRCDTTCNYCCSNTTTTTITNTCPNGGQSFGACAANNVCSTAGTICVSGTCCLTAIACPNRQPAWSLCIANACNITNTICTSGVCCMNPCCTPTVTTCCGK